MAQYDSERDLLVSISMAAYTINALVIEATTSANVARAELAEKHLRDLIIVLLTLADDPQSAWPSLKAIMGEYGVPTHILTAISESLHRSA